MRESVPCPALEKASAEAGSPFANASRILAISDLRLASATYD